MNRRKFIVASGIALTTAGCSGNSGSESTETTTTNSVSDTTTEGPTNDATTETTSTETPTTVAEPDIEVLEHEMVSYEGEYSTNTFVRASIKNNGNAPSGLLEPEAVFYDDSGSEMNVSSIAQRGVPGGETWEAYVQFLGDGSPSEYEFDLAHDSSSAPDYGVEGAELLESSLDTTGEVKINGTVKNTGETTLDYVEASPHFYAENGNLLWIGFTNVSDLAAGETWEFSSRFNYSTDEITNRVADHSVRLLS